jgi:hypothetical protein
MNNSFTGSLWKKLQISYYYHFILLVLILILKAGWHSGEAFDSNSTGYREVLRG